MRLTSFAALCTLSFAVAAYALVAYTVAPVGGLVHPDMRAAFEANRVAVYAHVFCSLAALAIGPLQFSTRLRARHLSLHRWLGRVYLGVAVLIGGISGLYLAFHAFGGLAARLGFGCLALAWLYTGLRAYRYVRAGRIAAHRAWMARNFALAFAAVTLRIYVPSSLAAGIEFETAYPYIAWACWVPNLVIAELLLRSARPVLSREPSPPRP